MQFYFATDAAMDVIVSVVNCALCRNNHRLPLLHIEQKIMVKSTHITFPFRVRCPTTGNHILIETVSMGPHNPRVHISVDIPPDIAVPPIESKPDKIEP